MRSSPHPIQPQPPAPHPLERRGRHARELLEPSVRYRRCALRWAGGLSAVHANNDRSNWLWRMMDNKVPIRSSLWSGTGTVIVEPGTCFSMMM